MKETKGYRIWDKQDRKYITRSAIYYTYSGYGDQNKSCWRQIPAIQEVINKSDTPERYEIHCFKEVFERIIVNE